MEILFLIQLLSAIAWRLAIVWAVIEAALTVLSVKDFNWWSIWAIVIGVVLAMASTFILKGKINKSNNVQCALCGNQIDKKALKINKRIKVNKKSMVCTKCMKNSKVSDPFTEDNMQFFK